MEEELSTVLAEAELLYSLTEIEDAISNMAEEIGAILATHNPIVLCVMKGAIMVTAQLLQKLNFPLQLEYIHATRYRGQTSAGQFHWDVKPKLLLRDRTVLIVDDILDHGVTLATIIKECEKQQPKKIYTAILVDKQLLDNSIGQADFTGLSAPNRYLFGYGMDYKEYHRNIPGIYAVKEA